MTEKKFKILVTEKVGQSGLDLLKEAPDVDLEINMTLTHEQLLEGLADVDGILTRSGTSMTSEEIEAAPKLKVIGRAGVGVDNINISEATRRGIIVVNAPTGNTLAATELTMANMLAMIRKVPQAHNSIHKGEWKRSLFTGMQLHGKKLLIIGLGRIGSQIAKRCRAFGMDVYAYDPYISNIKAESLKVTLLKDLPEALSFADVVTIHTPLNTETKNMFSREMLAKLKQGAYLINCARGGIVDEKAVTEAIREGHIAGFATDVYAKEPLTPDHPFLAKDIADKVVVTPHIGANTFEAQLEVSKIAAENMLAVLRGKPYLYAVNLPFMIQNLSDDQKKYLELSEKIGKLSAKLAEAYGSAVRSIDITYRGSVFGDDTPLGPNQYRPYTIAMLKGLLEVSQGEEISYMLAPISAKDRGIDISEQFGEHSTYNNLIEITLETDQKPIQIAGTITEEGKQRIVRINDDWIDFVPEGRLILFRNYDRPGVIGNVGSILVETGVNIASFALRRKDIDDGFAFAVLQVDDDVTPQLLQKLSALENVIWAISVDLREQI
ncbi:MAG: phosphoglycerate dehydrogenase [Synergistaceae bacterium]|nr:phosphoglycerate dehydrogenase [Synergistaceae bacterium]